MIMISIGLPQMPLAQKPEFNHDLEGGHPLYTLAIGMHSCLMCSQVAAHMDSSNHSFTIFMHFLLKKNYIFSLEYI
jgi:hypothetical protein